MLTDNRTFGEKASDWVCEKLGTWSFVITQTCIIILWVVANTLHGWKHWDTYPFILLNLGLSLQAAYTGAIVLMAQNRQAQKDRELARHTEHEIHRVLQLLLLEIRRRNNEEHTH